MNLLFKALGDQTRRDILEMLRKKDMSAGDIADAFPISKPSISYHLDLLKQANLVVALKKGHTSFIRSTRLNLTKSSHGCSNLPAPTCHVIRKEKNE